MHKGLWSFAVLFLLLSALADAQTITNPTKVVFTASPSHAAVDRYELRHFLVGGTAPVQVQNLGKPTPDATNTITAPITALPISTTNQYYAKVAAINAIGEGVSTASAESYFFVGAPEAPTNVSVRK